MNAPKRNRLLCSFAALAVLATPAQATVIGYFDAAYIAMSDSIYGWICESSSPNTAPPGDFLVKRDGTFNSLSYSVATHWGHYRPDVPAAGLCGSNAYTGFQLSDWFAASDLRLYYRDGNGNLHEMNGSPKNCSALGWC